MASKRTKTRYLDLNIEKGNFVTKLISGSQSYDFSDMALLRKVLSKEKARILYTLKTKNPKSIYELSKLLKRDFKAVREDIKILERFGIIEFHASRTGKREALTPVLTIDQLNIILTI